MIRCIKQVGNRIEEIFNEVLIFSVGNDLMFYLFTACWRDDPHQRPSFDEIMVDLIKIAESPFVYHESFHTMQDTWKVEIEDMVHEMRMKEKVRFFKSRTEVKVRK